MNAGGGLTEPMLGAARGMERPQLGAPRGLMSSVSDVFRTATQQPRLTESLDYEHVQNLVSMEYENALQSHTKRHIYG